jgi:hypothetical protein
MAFGLDDLILGGATLLGGFLGGRGAERGAKAAANAQERVAQLQDAYARELWQAGTLQTRPYREAGYTALAALMDMSGLNRQFRLPATLPGGPTRGPVNPVSQFISAPSANVPYPQRTAAGWGSLMASLNNPATATSGLGGAGTGSLGDTTIGMGSEALAMQPTYNWQTDPGYQFRFSEGMRALENSAAARGGLFSGAFGRGAIEYGQNMASAEYINIYNRLANIAGLGQTGSQNPYGGASSYLAANAGANLAGAGISRGSGYTGQANAWANTINQLSMMYGMSALGNRWQNAVNPYGSIGDPYAFSQQWGYGG